MVLLLTKLEKIQRCPIQDYWPDSTGQNSDSEAAQAFFVNKYLSLARRKDREIDVFCLDITDTDCSKPILQMIRDTAMEGQKAWVKEEHVPKQERSPKHEQLPK